MPQSPTMGFKKRFVRSPSNGSAYGSSAYASSASYDETTVDVDSFEFLRDEEWARSGSSSPLTLNDHSYRPMEPEELETIKVAFERGVRRRKPRVRRRYFVGYNRSGGRGSNSCNDGASFAGSDAVDFLVENGHASGRDHALRVGRMLAYEFGLYRHVTMDYDLEDRKDLYYTFSPPEERRLLPPRRSSSGEGEMPEQAPEMTYSLGEIAEAFEEGVVTGTNSYKGSAYHSTFVGSAAVSFLVSSQMAKTRQDAVRIGRLLMEKRRLFVYAGKSKQKFKDKHLLYRFVPRRQRVQQSSILPSIQRARNIPIEEMAVLFREVVNLENGTFSGSSAVDALVQSGVVSSRSEGVLLGHKLCSDMRLFHSISSKSAAGGERAFLDRPDVHYVYRMPPQQKDKKPNKQTFTMEIGEDGEYKLINELDLSWATRESGLKGTESAEGVINRIHRDQGMEEESEPSNDRQSFPCSLGDDVEYKLFEELMKSDTCLLAKKTSATQEAEFEEFMLSDSCLLEIKEDKPARTHSKNGGLDLNHLFDSRERQGDDFDCSDGAVHEPPGDLSWMYQQDPYSPKDRASGRYYDRFGFIVDNDAVSIDESDAASTYGADVLKMTEQQLTEQEWRDLIESCALTENGKAPAASLSKLKHCTRLGLPDSLRSRAWTVITGVDAVERRGDYKVLAETAARLMEEDDKGGEYKEIRGVIERDLKRTFPKHVLFCEDNDHSNSQEGTSGKASPMDINVGSDGLALLRRVLYAYSIYDNEVGYCQGMNFVAAMFLTFLSEEESFWLLVAVMTEEPYEMRDLFAQDMSGVHETLYVAEKLVQKFLPKLHTHLECENVNVSMFATQWLMTVFASNFPFDLVSRVWDSYIVEGWKVVYRVTLALLERAQASLLELDMEDILTYLRDEFPSSVQTRAASIMAASLRIPLRQRHIRKYTTEWRAMQGEGQRRRRLATHRESAESADDISSSRLHLKQRIIGQGAKYKKKLTY